MISAPRATLLASASQHLGRGPDLFHLRALLTVFQNGLGEQHRLGAEARAGASSGWRRSAVVDLVPRHDLGPLGQEKDAAQPPSVLQLRYRSEVPVIGLLISRIKMAKVKTMVKMAHLRQLAQYC